MVNIIEYNDHKIELKLSRVEVERMLIDIEKAGRTCLQSEGASCNVSTAGKFIRKIIKLRHFSVIEHSKVTVIFRNCTRAFTHSIVRNRLATFSQQSTVHALEFDEQLRVKQPVGVPLDVLVDTGILIKPLEITHKTTPRKMFKLMEGFYQGLRALGYETVQARYFLPIASCNDIAMTANFREWRHIFQMRLGKREDWENRIILVDLFEEMERLAPEIFFDFKLDLKDGGFGVPTYKCKYGS